MCQAGAGIVSTEGIADIVLDEGVRSPAVEGEVGVAIWAEGATVRDRPDAHSVIEGH